MYTVPIQPIASVKIDETLNVIARPSGVEVFFDSFSGWFMFIAPLGPDGHHWLFRLSREIDGWVAMRPATDEDQAAVSRLSVTNQ